MAGFDPRDPTSIPQTGARYDLKASSRRLKIRVATSLGFATAGSQACAATRAAAEVLADAGHEVVEADLDVPDPISTMMTLWSGHESVSYLQNLDEVADLLDPGYERLIRQGRELTAVDLAKAHEERASLRLLMLEQMSGFDMLLTPTMIDSAFPLGLDAPLGSDGQESSGLAWTPFTYLFNLTGQPAISLPAGLDDTGMPVGIQLVGSLHADADVLATARQYEELRPWQPNYRDLNPIVAPPS